MQDAHADEGHLGILFAYQAAKQLGYLLFLLLAGSRHIDGSMVGAQIVVAVGFVIHKRDQGHGGFVIINNVRAPIGAVGDGALVLHPYCGLLDGEHKTQGLSFLVQLGCAHLSGM